MFITLEGLDFSGKTTQAAMIAEHLEKRGKIVHSVREPGGTPISERIRELLADKSNEITARAEAMLFAASRAQLTETVIKPALRRREFVVSDRYFDSSIVYQGIVGGIDKLIAYELNMLATDFTEPDLTFLLDIPAEGAAARVPFAYSRDRIESRGLEYFKKVRDGYLEVAKMFERRYVIIDAGMSPERVFIEIRSYLDKRVDDYLRGIEPPQKPTRRTWRWRKTTIPKDLAKEL